MQPAAIQRSRPRAERVRHRQIEGLATEKDRVRRGQIGVVGALKRRNTPMQNEESGGREAGEDAPLQQARLPEDLPVAERAETRADQPNRRSRRGLPAAMTATIAIRKKNLRRRGCGGCVCSGQSIVSGNFSTPPGKICAPGHARIVQRARRLAFAGPSAPAGDAYPIEAERRLCLGA